MAIISLIGGLAVVLVAFVVGLIRLTYYAIKSDADVPDSSLDRLDEMTKLVLGFLFVVEVGGGIVDWLYDVWGLAVEVATNIL